jgi:predicted nucleic acid-binding protein
MGVLEAMKSEDNRAIVPVVWNLEVANVIAKAEQKGLLVEAQSEAFLEMLSGLDIDVDSDTVATALSDTLQIARRYRLSAYNASYMELSLRAGMPLATLDQDLNKAARRAGIKRFA